MAKVSKAKKYISAGKNNSLSFTVSLAKTQHWQNRIFPQNHWRKFKINIKNYYAKIRKG